MSEADYYGPGRTLIGYEFPTLETISADLKRLERELKKLPADQPQRRALCYLAELLAARLDTFAQVNYGEAARAVRVSDPALRAEGYEPSPALGLSELTDADWLAACEERKSGMELPKFNPALKAATDEELIRELESRFSATVVIVLHDAGDDAEAATMYHHGGFHTAIGLMRTMSHRLEHREGYGRND